MFWTFTALKLILTLPAIQKVKMLPTISGKYFGQLYHLNPTKLLIPKYFWFPNTYTHCTFVPPKNLNPKINNFTLVLNTDKKHAIFLPEWCWALKNEKRQNTVPSVNCALFTTSFSKKKCIWMFTKSKFTLIHQISSP